MQFIDYETVETVWQMYEKGESFSDRYIAQ